MCIRDSQRTQVDNSLSDEYPAALVLAPSDSYTTLHYLTVSTWFSEPGAPGRVGPAAVGISNSGVHRQLAPVPVRGFHARF